MMWLSPELKKFSFDDIMKMQGQIYREKEGRRTQKVTLEGKHYFIKQHFGVGWREIFKNLLRLRWPVLSASNEWEAIQRLNNAEVATADIVGYGCQGFNPAKRRSFLMTRELSRSISLEDICQHWKTKAPSFRFKQLLLQEVARISRVMHFNKITHRDFYLCHFLMTEKIYLIDLHRAQFYDNKAMLQGSVKDLGGLYFSSKDIGLTQRDLFRFMKAYSGSQSLGKLLLQEKHFWSRVKKRGDKLYKKHAKK